MNQAKLESKSYGPAPQVLAKIDQEHRETEEARVQAEADVVRYRHTHVALEVSLPATCPYFHTLGGDRNYRMPGFLVRPLVCSLSVRILFLPVHLGSLSRPNVKFSGGFPVPLLGALAIYGSPGHAFCNSLPVRCFPNPCPSPSPNFCGAI